MSDSVIGMTEFHGACIPSVWAQAIRAMVANVAETNAIVLIRGEPGTGKDLMAHVIHAASSRHRHPFIKISCTANPVDRLASMLFGHERGAFAGAVRRMLGGVEFANHGTLFLDEIGMLPRALQPGLLRVLQDHEFSRIGGREVIRVDVRLVAATTQSLRVTATSGGFWENSHGLKVVDLQIPPLRERRHEIPALASFFLIRFTKQYDRDAELDRETLALLTEYSWPGNVRELKDIVRRFVVVGDPRQIHEEIHSRLRLIRPSPATLESA